MRQHRGGLCRRAGRNDRSGGWISATVVVSVFVIGPLLLNLLAFAETEGKYAVTIVKVELKNQAGQWVKVIQPDRLVDLLNEEPSVSFFNNEGRVPPGSYVNFRVTLSETVRIAGRLKGGHCTRADGAAVMGGTAARATELPGEITSFKETAPTWREGSPADVGESTIQFNFDHEDADDVMTISSRADFETPVDVRKGDFIKVWFDVDAADSVRHALPGAFGPGVPARHVMYAIPPAVEELVLVVGETERSLTGSSVAFDF